MLSKSVPSFTVIVPLFVTWPTGAGVGGIVTNGSASSSVPSPLLVMLLVWPLMPALIVRSEPTTVLFTVIVWMTFVPRSSWPWIVAGTPLVPPWPSTEMLLLAAPLALPVSDSVLLPVTTSPLLTPVASVRLVIFSETRRRWRW